MNEIAIPPGCTEQVRFNLLFKKPVGQSMQALFYMGIGSGVWD